MTEYEIRDRLGLLEIKKDLTETLEQSGFTAVEEFTDADCGAAEGCFALWSVDRIKLGQAAQRNGTVRASVVGELRFRVKLMGRIGNFGDHRELDDRCFEVCAALSCLRRWGSVEVELGSAENDMQMKRAVRELGVAFAVCMEEV